ncbi:MAG TPA: hypothetical protein PKD72_15560, partial [Gemmatales bacterium]|nr:hypothetical protein [Gemmatales bacterium]
DGTKARVLTQRNDETLTKIAQLTHGSLIREAGNPAEISNWWHIESQKIPGRLLESQVRFLPIDQSPWFLGLAGLLLVLESTLGGWFAFRW